MLTILGFAVSAAVVSSIVGALPRDARSLAAADEDASQPKTQATVYPFATTQVPSRTWVRPMRAPNDASWPVSSGYVAGYSVGRQSGDGRVTIDGRKHPSDVLLRLYYLGANGETPVRTVFIAGGERFTLANLSWGSYEVRYRDLDSGVLTRSQRFDVDEDSVETTLTLYTPSRPSLASFASDESQFPNVIGSESDELE